MIDTAISTEANTVHSVSIFIMPDKKLEDAKKYS
jgi:hypothetical protein